MNEQHFPDPKLVGPAAFYVRGEDHLRVVTRNGATGVTVSIEGRFLDVEGEVRPFVFPRVLSTDRAAQTFDTGLGHGWILNVSGRVTAGTPSIGETFVQLRVIRGLGEATINVGTLVQGYVTESDDLAWPGAPIRSSVDGPGALRIVAGADPAAGAEASITQPARTRWRPLAFNVTLVTSATAANRETVLTIDLGSGLVLSLPSGLSQAASLTRVLTWLAQSVSQNAAVSTQNQKALGEFLTPAGTVFATVTTAIDALDDYGVPRMLVEEWVED